MKGAKSNLKKLVKGLNEMTDEEQLDYKTAITKEDQKFNKGSLKSRQKKVVDGIMEDLNIKEGGSKEMATKKGGVKQITKVKAVVKAVVPPKVKVSISEAEKRAKELLRQIESKVARIGKVSLETTHIGCYYLKKNSRLVLGILYRVSEEGVVYSLVAPEALKNHSKDLPGSYAPGNWNILFGLDGDKDITKLNPIIEASIAKHKKAELPKDKVKKKK